MTKKQLGRKIMSVCEKTKCTLERDDFYNIVEEIAAKKKKERI